MTTTLPSPSIEIATVRRAHIETDRGARFADLLDRLTAREAQRDFYTGLLPETAAPAPTSALFTEWPSPAAPGGQAA